MAQAIATSAESGNFYDLGPNALVIAAEAERRAIAAEALALAGVRIAGQVDFASAAMRLAEQGGLDMIVLDAGGAPADALDTVLARVDALARERLICVVASMERAQIDSVAAQLGAPRTQLLCEPDAGERFAAIACARRQAEALVGDARRPGGARHVAAFADASREAESARLRRLNEEVARIADTLARLTRGEEPAERGGVRAPDMAYRGPETANAAETSAHEIRAAIRVRRLRDQFFESGLFADPAWDMLLDLLASELEDRQVSVSSLCIAAAVPPTTALRWIATMHDAGLFERHADPNDRRRAYIALSAKGREGMRAYLAAVKRQGLAIA